MPVGNVRQFIRDIIVASGVGQYVNERISYGFSPKQGSPTNVDYITFNMPINHGFRTLIGPTKTRRAEFTIKCWSDDIVKASLIADLIMEYVESDAITLVEGVQGVFVDHETVAVTEELGPPVHAQNWPQTCVAFTLVIWYEVE